jgi:hypothetical protein
MKKVLGLLLLTFAVQPLLAKENWPLTVTVLSTKNIEDEHGSFHLSWGGGSGGSSWSHRVHEDDFVEASDGNSYDLQPKNPKDMLLPGTYKAKIEKRDMKVCEPKDNGNCREVKFWIVGAVPTARIVEPSHKTAELAPTSAAVAPSPAPSTSALPLAATQQAVLNIESTPSGADIEIDGAFVGNTPSTVNAGLGSHKIAVKKEGFADWTKTINVTGGTVHLNAEMKHEPPKQ